MFCPRCGTRAPDDSAACTLCGLAFHADAAPRAAEPPSAAVLAIVTYAGFWRRAAAFLIDVVISYFPVATFRVLLGRAPTSVFDPLSSASWAAGVFELVFDWLYAALLISSSRRGTLGQQVMDLHVTDANGGRVSFARASWRHVAQALNLLSLGFGYVLQVFSPRRQALHDLVSGTVVVRPRPAVAMAAGAPPAPAMPFPRPAP